MTSNKKKVKKAFRLPDTYLMILVIMLIVAVLSYILPAGTYDTITDPVTGRCPLFWVLLLSVDLSEVVW